MENGGYYLLRTNWTEADPKTIWNTYIQLTEVEDAFRIAKLKNWFAAMGCPTSLADAGIPENDIDKIAENAFALAQTWQLPDYTREVIADVLRQCR